MKASVRCQFRSHYWTQNPNMPFGVLMENGTNFAHSVKNASSRLAQIVRYLRIHDGEKVTRRDILRDVYGINPDKIDSMGRRFGSGYACLLLSGAAKAGFIAWYRDDHSNNVYYTLGPNFEKVKV